MLDKTAFLVVMIVIQPRVFNVRKIGIGLKWIINSLDQAWASFGPLSCLSRPADNLSE